MNITYSRQIDFESIRNFRDLGGYRTQKGQIIAWRRLFRSGELRHMTGHDITIFKEVLKLNTVVDLRHPGSVGGLGVGPLNALGVKYYPIPLYVPLAENSQEHKKERELFKGFSNLGEVYSYRIRQPEVGHNIVKILEIIANRHNLPLVFHCNAGQSRTGIIAAILLKILGVDESDIVLDYTLTSPLMKEFVERWNRDPATAHIHKAVLPYENEAAPESMELFLKAFKNEYGSAEAYLSAHGGSSSLVGRLEKALLV